MNQGKTYAAHVSFVNQCETNVANSNHFFTSAISDECVIKWKLFQEDQFDDLDFIEYPIEHPDIFSEVITRDKFINMINEVLPVRQETNEIK